jgi:hypothetical protein
MTMNYTELMYDTARAAYNEIGRVHGYTGLCRGLSAVTRDLGFDLPWQYFSDHHHDPLSELATPFEHESLTFEELIHSWDLRWFGLGTGRFHELPFPFGDPDKIHISGGYHPLDLTWIKNQVVQELKKLKIRRGTKRHAAFVNENAQKVVDFASSSAQRSSEAIATDLQKKRQEVASLAAKALSRYSDLELDMALRAKLLEAAGLIGSPVVDDEFSRMLAAWDHAVRSFEEKTRYTDSLIAQYSDPNLAAIGAVEAMSHDNVLAPFPRTLKLTT